MRESPLSARGPLAHPAARRTREVRGGEVPKLCAPQELCRGRPPAPTTAFGYAYRTTALGAQRVHGKGLEVKGVEVKGVPNPLARLLHSSLLLTRHLGWSGAAG